MATRRRTRHLPSGAKIVSTYIPPPKNKNVHHHHHHTRIVKSDSCFPAAAKVMTPGGWTAISDLGPGDQVMSLNPATHTLVPRAVIKRLEHNEARLLEIQLSGSTTPILTTGNHRFHTQNGWIQAKSLRAGDIVSSIRDLSAAEASVISVRMTDKSERVYNLHTAGEHNFIVDGLVAHNFAHFLWIRTVFHRTFIDGRTPEDLPEVA